MRIDTMEEALVLMSALTDYFDPDKKEGLAHILCMKKQLLFEANREEIQQVLDDLGFTLETLRF